MSLRDCALGIPGMSGLGTIRQPWLDIPVQVAQLEAYPSDRALPELQKLYQLLNPSDPDFQASANMIAAAMSRAKGRASQDKQLQAQWDQKSAAQMECSKILNADPLYNSSQGDFTSTTAAAQCKQKFGYGGNTFNPGGWELNVGWCEALPSPLNWVCKNPGKSAAIALGIPTLLYLGPVLIGRAKSWSRAVSS